MNHLFTSLHFSPRGETKCVRGASVQGPRRSTIGGVLAQYVEHDEQAQRSNSGPFARFGRQLVRNARRCVPFVLLLAAATGAASAQDDQHRWNLADIYPDQQAWREAKTAASKSFAQLDPCKGKLGESATSLLGCLDTLFAVRKEVVRVFGYASMLSDEDTRVDQHSQMRSEARLLSTEFSEKTSFLRPELLTIDKQKIDRFVGAEDGLAIYRVYLDDVLRQAPHTRSPDVEQVLAQSGPAARSASSIRRTLANAELPWPQVKLSSGDEIRLDTAAYAKYRASPGRDDRKLVFSSFWDVWKQYERTLGAALYSNLQADHFYSQARNYPNSLGAALAEDNIPESVYRTLVRETHAGLPVLYRYFKLRADMLGVDDLAYYDVYPPLVKGTREFSLDQAKDLAIAAARPFGFEYVAVMKRGFAERWVDFMPRPGKRSGAYMSGSIYDVHPFMLMNFNADFGSVRTLAHEFGHAMHSHLAKNSQPYPTSDYAIFVAELASTTNEALLQHHMLQHAESDEERLFYLGNDLERIRGTFFRQVMFAEFELKAHELVDSGEALTGGRFTEIYGDLLRRYHGHDQGVLTIDDLYTVEWSYIPHFYRNFYVYQYATSIAGGSLLAADIIAGKPGAVERYLDLLRAGSSKYPYELLKDAGVDLTTPTPYRTLIAHMTSVMDEIEKIRARQNTKR